MRHLLSAGDLTAESAAAVLDTADTLKRTLLQREVRKLPTLRGRTVLTLFFENSTRTRVSFEVAGKWMSADVVNVSVSASSVGKGESLRDTALTLSAAGADCVIVRHPASGAAQRLATWLDSTGTQVVNAGDGTHEHPTQALLDGYTLQRQLGGPGSLEGKRVAIVGDLTHSRVFRSNVKSLTKLGASVIAVAPPTLMPSGIAEWAKADGFATSYSLDDVLPEVDAVMMLRVQRERMSGGYFPTSREYTVGYGLTRQRLGMLREGAPILHPGPMNRGLEISPEAADAVSSRILDQVSAGVAIRMSVLYHLLAGEESA